MVGSHHNMGNCVKRVTALGRLRTTVLKKYLSVHTQLSLPDQPSGIYWSEKYLSKLLSPLGLLLLQWNNSKLEKKGCIWLCFHISVHHPRKSGQELKQRPWGMLLAGLFSLAFSDCLPKAHIQGPVWCCAQANLGGISWLMVPLPVWL